MRLLVVGKRKFSGFRVGKDCFIIARGNCSCSANDAGGNQDGNETGTVTPEFLANIYVFAEPMIFIKCFGILFIFSFIKKFSFDFSLFRRGASFIFFGKYFSFKKM